VNKEYLFSNLGFLCEPKREISDKRLRTKWNSIPYETGGFKGEMLVSLGSSKANDVFLNPELEGWYKIFVGLYAVNYHTSGLEMKLSSDKAFVKISTSMQREYSEHIVEDVFWKCAKMDGEKIVIGKHLAKDYAFDAMIAWIRLVPMTDEEVQHYHYEKSRTDTKRIYATNDMHCMLCMSDMKTEESWRNVVQEYIDSDVEWLAIETIDHNDGNLIGCDIDEFSFHGVFDKNFQRDIKKYYSDDVMKNIVAYGKEQGFKMCISTRVSFWGAEFPHDEMYFDQKFAADNPGLRCIDRDGEIVDYMSFMYPEVQEYLIERFKKMASFGPDAVQPLFSRGWPYILFEKPFTDLFMKRYGEDARELPLDDERIIELKCEIMTDFVRKLKNAIVEVNPQIELHAKVMFSIYDNLLVGLDLEAWAKEGLVERIVTAERRIREIVPDSIRQDADKSKIDIEKYAAYANSSFEPPVVYHYDAIFEPLEDSKGVLRGPKDNPERIREFVRLEKEYGMTAYIEIMPRILPPDKIKRKALEIYDAGATHIGLWDTYSRSPRKVEWSMWSRIGHMNELKDFSNGEGEFYTAHRLKKIGTKDVRCYHPVWGG